mmetsp:Transcript_16938/g.42310  ORF Transcript_16938/g.42310 Transcript_16938/m.42310 type:complete len:109 (-) Transcript_16938:570-896(-)
MAAYTFRMCASFTASTPSRSSNSSLGRTEDEIRLLALPVAASSRYQAQCNTTAVPEVTKLIFHLIGKSMFGHVHQVHVASHVTIPVQNNLGVCGEQKIRQTINIPRAD